MFKTKQNMEAINREERMKKTLKELLSEEIKIDFSETMNIKENEIMSYIHKWPEKFFAIIIELQKNKKKEYTFYLPDGNGKLIFNMNKTNNKIKVTFKKLLKKEFNKRFSWLLAKIFEELNKEKINELEVNEILKKYKNKKRKNKIISLKDIIDQQN